MGISRRAARSGITDAPKQGESKRTRNVDSACRPLLFRFWRSGQESHCRLFRHEALLLDAICPQSSDIRYMHITAVDLYQSLVYQFVQDAREVLVREIEP